MPLGYAVGLSPTKRYGWYGSTTGFGDYKWGQGQWVGSEKIKCLIGRSSLKKSGRLVKSKLSLAGMAIFDTK